MNFLINEYAISFVIWNLFLLLLPSLICALMIDLWQKTGYKKIGHWLSAGFLFVLWLVIIPNSAYVIADIRHITGFCPPSENRICSENAWHIMFFFTYGLLGWLAFVYFLNQMKYLIEVVLGASLAKIYIFAMMPIVSLGVLLGLVDRLNTWDLIFHPVFVFKTVFLYFSDFFYLRNFLLFTVFFSILYLIGNFLLKPFLSYGLSKNRKSS